MNQSNDLPLSMEEGTGGRGFLSLFDLNALVRSCMEQCLPDEYWVQAELSDVRTNSTGHCYLEFIQKDARGKNLIAKARGTIWANVFRLLKPYFEETTGRELASGIKVLVLVTVSFHELYGYTLTVQDIDPTYTLGDMARRRREILNQLEEEGVLTLNKELEMPLLPQRIAVISSSTAAGYGDFCHQLENNPRNFFFYTELFPALMQGDRVEDTVLSALDKINARMDEFDVVVIIRGGGATSDLSGFDTYLLAAACAQFPLPIITGIGHERDDTVIDSVAHSRVKTPTAAAEFLIDRMGDAADGLDILAARLQEGARSLLERERRKIIGYKNRIPAVVYRILSSGRLSLITLRKDLISSLRGRLSGERHRLELLQQRLKDASPEHLLARGYSITLKDGKVVKDFKQVQEGNEIVTRIYQGELLSVVKASKKRRNTVGI
ncbi:exodeoxyribonuclease VII large subunit [Bacteroides zoogleoformans]|uniref:exodeoxyribonuclease VII large subunit n=1 Tax=Bacteroides zoogleoformans TaxID=28119 RepID=UPI00248E1370|nr:exodeoxyribonuclease VII large subunit [Bacteroides zoogleoformans]